MMTGAFRTLVAMAVLLAVAATLIAPSVDLPETVLHEHHLVSHANGEHAQGKLQTTTHAGHWHAWMDAMSGAAPAGLRSPARAETKPFRVLRC
jgi:hypothetical protein